jgi:outer membrane protein assembly factor BamE (lipoprotein component of BamABCDE complex)
MRRLIAALSIILVLACACAALETRETTEESVAANVSQIKTGISSKSEVRALLGEPVKVTSADNGEEIWEYVIVRGRVRAGTTLTYNLVIRFNREGIVKSLGRAG